MNRQTYRQRLADMLLRGDTFSAPRDSAGPDHDHYNPHQPRVPAGHSDGGQWTRGGGVGQITPKSPPVMHDLSGQETWKTVATDRRPDGSIAEQLIVNRDGSRIRSQYAPLGANGGWDERHTVTTPDGRVVMFENSGLTQTIYDGQGRKVSQTVMTQNGPVPLMAGDDESLLHLARAPAPGDLATKLPGRLKLIGIAATLLYTWMSRWNSGGRQAVLSGSTDLYRRGEPGEAQVIWVGYLNEEQLRKACDKYHEVQTSTDKATRLARAMPNAWTPRTFGTEVHTRVAHSVNGTLPSGDYRSPDDPKDINFRAEFSLLKTRAADPDAPPPRYGQRGTIRIDVFENREDTSTVCIYDIKTGSSGFTPARRMEMLRSALRRYPDTKSFVITEVRPH
jgi:hypothetical protein